MRTKDRRWIWIATGGFIFWIGVSLAIAQGRNGGQARDNWADNLPPGDGKVLTTERCGSCHSLDARFSYESRRTDGKTSSSIWSDEARRSLSMRRIRSEYLTAVLGPDAPPFIYVNRASKDDMIKIPGLTAELADKLLAYRQRPWAPYFARSDP